MKTVQDNVATNFLLGKLTEAENIRIEADYFSRDDLFEDILIAENELIDAYAMGQLAPEDQSRFENRLLLNPQQRQRVQFAKTLVKYASGQPLFVEELEHSAAKSSWISVISLLTFKKPALSLSFALAALIFFAGGIWLLSNKFNSNVTQSNDIAVNQTPPNVPEKEPASETMDSDKNIESNPKVAPSSQKSNQTPLPPKKQEKPQRKEIPVIYSLILSPGLTRDAGDSQRFTIPAKADFVKIRLQFEQGGFSSYHAVLETVEGRQVWSSKNLKVRKDDKSLEVLIPSKFLKKSDYILTLSGITTQRIYERVEDYTFTINP